MEHMDEQALTGALEAVVKKVCPEAILVAKYGGKMVEVTPGEVASQVGGFFFYDTHASFEFSRGCDLDDPQGLLAGKGKFRRHVKLRRLADIEAMQVEAFLRQAVGAPS